MQIQTSKSNCIYGSKSERKLQSLDSLNINVISTKGLNEIHYEKEQIERSMCPKPNGVGHSDV